MIGVWYHVLRPGFHMPIFKAGPPFQFEILRQSNFFLFDSIWYLEILRRIPGAKGDRDFPCILKVVGIYTRKARIFGRDLHILSPINKYTPNHFFIKKVFFSKPKIPVIPNTIKTDIIRNCILPNTKLKIRIYKSKSKVGDCCRG